MYGRRVKLSDMKARSRLLKPPLDLESDVVYEMDFERSIEVISKRLHVSGLTPAISFDDLSRRLGSFGSVTALDGLGKLDALGQPRKFAYVTLQTTKPQLSRCMNALSGSTWKGAKLRIGEAKPDFRERIILENTPKVSDDTRPQKRRRLARGVHGRHAQDMSLITPENVHQHPQWRITPLGRLIRPMRMRPARALDPPLHTLRAKDPAKGKGKAKKKERRARAPPTRARRQTIDPLRWGSTHLSGIFLDGGGNGESTEVEEVEHILDVSDQTPPAGDDQTPPLAGVGAELDLAAETASALYLLSAMFGEANVDWGGAEGVDSDVEMAGVDAVIPHASPPGPIEPANIEVVPVDQEPRAAQGEEKRSVVVDRQTKATPTTGPALSSTKLKDLFAPREEEGFSLINNLDLDSELDLDMDLNLNEPAFPNAAAPAPVATSSRSAASITVPTTQHRALDSSLPFFFPQKGQVRGVRFARTEDEVQIRARWEAARGELTREWKRRHREAVKSRRRRGGERVD
ncbi:hypothetical protein BJY52DRAFT_1428421 [Lactarius psammicola]|nr:hypothetical protein BJY52DRAFT_1428421 [Lactarius psammicola]